MLDVERKVEMLEFSRNSMGGWEVRDFRPTQGPGVVGSGVSISTVWWETVLLVGQPMWKGFYLIWSLQPATY
jgi:hypothetical protein